MLEDIIDIATKFTLTLLVFSGVCLIAYFITEVVK